MTRFRIIMLSILSGISLALIGITLGFGKRAGLRPIEIMLVGTGIGSVVFTGKQICNRQATPITMCIWAWGVAAGIGQYLTMRGTGMAMQLGPLSPVWCAASLGFIVVSFYSAVRYQERMNLVKSSALAAGLGCVVVSAITNSRGGGTINSFQGALGYGAVLLAIMVFNSLNSVAIKTLGMSAGVDQSGKSAHDNHRFLAVMYTTCFLMVLTDLLWNRNPNLALGTLLAFGLVAALGSTCGLALLAACASAPASLVYTLSGITGIVTAALVSVLFLEEQAGIGWYVTIGLGVLSIVLGALAR